MSNRRYNKNEVIVVEQKLLKHRAWWELGGAREVGQDESASKEESVRLEHERIHTFVWRDRYKLDLE